MRKDQRELPTSFDAKALDGAAVVRVLSPSNSTTFDEYANSVSVPHLMKHLGNAKRVDVVWDAYLSSSIKRSTREKRGEWIRKNVAGKHKVPRNWKDCHRNTDNKRELFVFL